MRTLYPFLLVLPLVTAACGREISDTLGDGGSHHSGDDDGGTADGGRDDGGDDEDGGSCSTEPLIACVLPCNAGYTDPTCVDGQWTCPEYGAEPVGCPEQDGGTPCNGPSPECGVVSPCPGVYEEAVCQEGTWTCEWVGTCDDGGVVDASPPVDANPPPLFSCGDLACNATESYCQITTGGVVSADGGVSSGYQCIPTPGSCPAGVTDCSCVQALQGIGCGCVNGPDNEVIVTCDVP